MSSSLLLLTMTATIATASAAASNPIAVTPAAAAAEAAPMPVAPPPAPPVVPAGKGLAWTIGDFDVRLLAQYWVRGVADSGRDLKEGPLLEYVGQRARLGLEVNSESGFGLRVLLQDVRTWGEELDSLADFSAAGLDVQEAFLGLPIPGLGRARIGRQELVLEDARLVGNVVWTLRARSFDAIRLDGSWDALKAMLFYAKVQERDRNPDGTVPADVARDRDLAVAYLSYDFLGHQHLSLSYLYDGTPDGNRQIHTVGPTFRGALGGLDYAFEAYLQTGKQADARKTSFLATGQLGYTFDQALKPRIFGFLDVVSSDGTRTGTFDTLYATNHKFYGEMDFFLNLPVHTGGLGLINPGLGLALQPLDRLKLQLTWYDFRAYQPDPTLGRLFGDEVDLKADVAISDYVKLDAVYGLFAPGHAFERRFGTGNQQLEHFFYTTITAEL